MKSQLGRKIVVHERNLFGVEEDIVVNPRKTKNDPRQENLFARLASPFVAEIKAGMMGGVKDGPQKDKDQESDNFQTSLII